MSSHLTACVCEVCLENDATVAVNVDVRYRRFATGEETLVFSLCDQCSSDFERLEFKGVTVYENTPISALTDNIWALYQTTN